MGGAEEGGGVLLSIVAPAPVRPGNESGVLRIGCLNLRGCNEVEKRDEIGSMSVEAVLRFSYFEK